MKKMKKNLATVLAWVMAFSVIPVMPVHAEETAVETEVLEVEKENEETVVDEEIKLNYLYVSQSKIALNDTQDIVVSWGNGNENVEKAELWYQIDGEMAGYFTLENKGSGLFLYQDSMEKKGDYHFTCVKMTVDGKQYECFFEEIGIEAVFEVDSEKAEEISGVAVIDVDSVENDQAEEIVAEAIEEVISENETGLATYAMEEDTKAGTLVIALDPGHDATHAGAQGNGVKEEVATLKIAQYCKEELEKYQGVEVYMSRETEECPYPGTTSSADIRQRVQASAEKSAEIFVSIHLNSSESSAANGAEVWYPDSSQTPDTTEEGKGVAEEVQKELASLGLNDRGAKETDDNFTCMDEGGKHNLPAIIIEHAFVSNESDAEKYLSSDEKLKQLGAADARGIASYYNLELGENGSSEIKDGWVQTDNGWMWRENGEYYKNRWLNLDGDWYWLDANGYRATGWMKIGDYYYYFDTDGKMQTGWLKIDGKTYYLHSSGRMLTGWQTIDGKKYYFKSNGEMVTGTVTIDGKKYVFDENGVCKGEAMSKGWNLVDGIWYYVKADGSLATGWMKIGDYYYYFDADGKMQTGWLKIDGKTYYLHSSGRMLTGWQTISGKKYYFKSSGEMVTGVVTINGKVYRFDENGVYQGEGMKKGWNQIDGTWYYVKADGSLATGWAFIGDYYYYFDSEGRMLTGWQLIGGYYYYFHSAGRMLTGWQTIDGNVYYFHSAGRMLTGWQTIDGKKYYFKSSGEMVTGEVTIDGKKYLFDENGVCQGEVVEEGMKKGWNLVDGIWYYVKADGSLTTGWARIGDYDYYFDSEGRMLTGLQTIDGNVYYFHSSGRMLTGWQEIEGKTYYFKESGEMVTGWVEISGEWHYFDSDGVLKQSGVTAICGKAEKTKEKMIAFYNASGYTYPSEALGAGGAETIEQFVEIYLEEAEIEGIRADVAFAQAMLETKYLQYGGDVKIEQFNFAGLGATGGGEPGNSFEDVRTGVRAHIQHLKAYATTEELVQECVDTRYKYVEKGCAPYVEWLGINENPNGKGWATSKEYGFNIMKLVNKM